MKNSLAARLHHESLIDDWSQALYSQSVHVQLDNNKQ